MRRRKDYGKSAAHSHSGEGQRYELILEVAARLFAAEGYTRTSLDMIAREVGLHKATLYHYFASKDEILETCLSLAAADISLASRHLSDGSERLLDRLNYFFSSLVVAQNGRFGRCVEAVDAESLRLEPAGAIRAFKHELEDEVGAALADGITRGEVRQGDPQEMARMIFGAFHWLPRWYRPGKGASLGTIALGFVDFAATGIAGAQSISIPANESEPVAGPRKPADRREEIVLLATRCFAEKGYDAASIGDIAQAVGLQKASLYHYFPGKAAILSACAELAHGDIDPLLDTVIESDRPFEERFFGFLRRLMLAQNSEYGHYLYMVRDDQLDAETLVTVRRFRKRLTSTLRALIAEGVASGQLRPLDVPLASGYIFGVTNSVPRWYEPTRDGDLGGVIDRILEMILNGFAATAR